MGRLSGVEGFGCTLAAEEVEVVHLRLLHQVCVVIFAFRIRNLGFRVQDVVVRIEEVHLRPLHQVCRFIVHSEPKDFR